MGGDAPISELELRLSPDGDEATVFELEHTAIVPEDVWDEYGPGAVGVGWDQGLLGLALHLRAAPSAIRSAWQLSEEGRDVRDAEQRGMGRGERGRRRRQDTVARNVANTTAFYAPDPTRRLDGAAVSP